jgi:hypothetical protein
LTARQAVLTAGCTALGAGVCWVYVGLLRRAMERMTERRARRRAFIGAAVLRVGLLAAGGLAAAWAGLWPLLGYLAGFFVLRTIVLARAGTPGEEEADDA